MGLQCHPNQAALESDGNCFGAILHTEFGKDGLEMRLGPVLTEPNEAGNFLVTESFSQQLEHFQLPGRERWLLLNLRPASGDSRREPAFATMDRA